MREYADLRKVVSDAFSSEELDALCFDYYREVYDDFTEGMTRSQRVQLLIAYCERHKQVSSLWAVLRRERPGQVPELEPLIATESPPQALEPPSRERNPQQVFISYAHQDTEFAHRLAGDLYRHGWTVWMTPESICPGEKWVEAIERGLSESGVLVCILTPAALVSSWVKSEIDHAIQAQHQGLMRLVPLYAKPCQVTGLLGNYQYASFVAGYKHGLAELLTQLGRIPGTAVDLSATKTHQHPHPQPARWFWIAVIVVTVLILIAIVLGSGILSPPAPPDELVLQLSGGITMTLVRIPAGEFLMGSDPARDPDASVNEQPQHRVSVSEFHIGKYEITVAQFAAFVQDTNHSTTAEQWGKGYVSPDKDLASLTAIGGANWQHPNGPESDVASKSDHPVTQVSYYDAVAFCNWLSKLSGWTVRLPTEAEWEKAARGRAGLLYPWGSFWDIHRLNSKEGGARDTTPVGKYSPIGDSPFGIADMAGNVSEWTGDWYSENEYTNHVRSNQVPQDPSGPSTGTHLAVRSGSWIGAKDGVRSATRLAAPPWALDEAFGFRVVLVMRPSSQTN